MGNKTGIEWTDATWNPVVGCSVISPGCTNCYAMKLAHRLERMGSPIYRGHTIMTKAGPVWNGTVDRSNWGKVIEPMKWNRPRRIFVNSMSDLFHEALPDETIDTVFAVMALCPQHTFQVLTKRADRMRRYMERIQECNGHIWHAMDELLWDPERRTFKECSDKSIENGIPLPHVWLGVSVEDQVRADERIPALLATPAANRFLSCEPLLGPVDLSAWLGVHHHPDNDLSNPVTAAAIGAVIHAERRMMGGGIDWVICGGESGSGARPMHPDWARGLRDQCAAAGARFFFKQWGEWLDADSEAFQHLIVTERRFEAMAEYHEPTNGCYHVGKKLAGDHLDGRQHHEVPA